MHNVSAYQLPTNNYMYTLDLALNNLQALICWTIGLIRREFVNGPGD